MGWVETKAATPATTKKVQTGYEASVPGGKIVNYQKMMLPNTTPKFATPTYKTTTVAGTAAEGYDDGSGETPQVTPAMADYGYSVNINVPDFNWNPTTDQLAQYLQSGTTRANTVIDPQVQAVLQALSRFKTEASNQQAEINPRYTNMSLALANVIKNQVYQPGVDSLIRRGAADSGALQQLGENAGKYEVEQRANVEQERNTILNALANQVLGKEQETTDAQTALEKLRGQYTDVYAGEEQQKAYEKDFTGKQSKFNADLSVGQLQNQVAAAIANQQYQQAVLAAQQQQSGFENSMAEKEFGLQQALSNYNMRPKTSSTPTTPTQMITVSTPYGQIPMTVQQAISAGYLSGKTNTESSGLPWD